MKSKHDFERTHRPYLHYVIRPIGRRCLPWAIRWDLTPNQVTLSSTVALLVSMVLYGMGGYWLQLLAAGMLQIREILDTVDGDLARKTDQTSRRGEYLDALGGYLLGGLLLPSIGLGLALMPDATHRVLSSVVQVPSWLYFAIGLWAGLANVLVRLISLRHCLLLGESLRKSDGTLLRTASWFEDSLLPLLLVAAAARSTAIVILLFGLFYTVRLLYVLCRALGGADAGQAS
ncbi:CDP-alcohol phosphatidyltransferase family protein [Candidatus Bipolaricaulota bacterium]